MTIILLSGKQGSGKSSLQRQLVLDLQKLRGHRAFAVNFADILYEMHDHVLNILHQYWPPRGLKKDGPLLQLLGTEWGRNTIDTDIWAKCLKAKILKLEHQFGGNYQQCSFIIGDCRFQNEFALFPEALRVRLEAPIGIRKDRCEMWRDNDTHPSEIDLDDCSAAGLFDLYLNTATTPISGCSDLVVAQLDKKVWLEKRGA